MYPVVVLKSYGISYRTPYGQSRAPVLVLSDHSYGGWVYGEELEAYKLAADV